MPPLPRRAMGTDRNRRQLNCPVPIAPRGSSAEIARTFYFLINGCAIKILMIVFLLMSGAMPLLSDARADENVAILDADTNSVQLNLALKKLQLPASIHTRFFTLADLMEPGEKAREARTFIDKATVVFVNVMHSDLVQYMVTEKLMTPKTVYGMSQGRDMDTLKKQGFIFDKAMADYHGNLCVPNIINMVRMAVHRHVDSTITFAPAQQKSRNIIHHPGALEEFEQVEDYRNWYENRQDFNPKAPWVAMLFYASSLQQGQNTAVDEIILRLEHEGFNVMPCFGTLKTVFSRFLLPANPRVDMVLAFTMKFSSSINPEIHNAVNDLNVPIFNVIRPYGTTIKEWRNSELGLTPLESTWALSVPECSGAIEPTVVAGKKQIWDDTTGKRLYIYENIDETLSFLIARLKKLAILQKKPNPEKKVAIFYYNHSQGKQNIGASYLNVFRSLQEMLGRMAKEGYKVDNVKSLSEAGIQKLVMATGRNIGSWAPGELDAMMASGHVEKIPLATYEKWFKALPPDFQEKVTAQWGSPANSAIMVKDGQLIFPMVKLGNLVLLPEPARGYSDDPMKLYHDPTLYPHHQYIAAYLWLNHVFHADAMVHLGTHATYEWLPGKQSCLAPWDPPEIMVGDIPNIYPYIVDDVGEGIQAKRRGRAVIIDHLTPPMAQADLYNEYAELKVIMGKYELSQSMASDTAGQYLMRMEEMARDLGLLTDLGLEAFDHDAVEALDLYLHEMETNSLPHGLHTFGTAWSREAVQETLALIAHQNPNEDKDLIHQNLVNAPVREMDNFIRALDGEYIPAGEGNDPVRNLAAIPTGKNFYGFSPARVPSRAAWEMGKKAAEALIQDRLKKDGTYPQKVGVVLWATETTRNEGVHESTILYLMGMEPVWDATGRVTDSRVIPGKILGRPRIDVLINPSGLYRDMFPDKLLFLDKAVQKAMAQTDMENFLAKNKNRIKAALMESGLDEAKAEEQSRFRIFTENTGSYGNGVAEMAGNSGVWESDEEISRVYMNRTQFAVGQGKWTTPVKQALKENLRDVDITVHSRSSNIYGLIDTDDFFMYLGGMSLAVKNIKGKAPDTRVTLNRQKNEVIVEDAARTIGREMRTRYLNPQWIGAMKKENYAGARQMSEFVENFWGWQVTVPDAVGQAQWQQINEVYVEDKYGQNVKAFLNEHNPWAYQSMTARMLEAVRKGYWQADKKVTSKLAMEYAVNAVEKGVACCDHTCNNPLLNQMVVNLISVPGVLSPEVVEQFKMAIEKMAKKSLNEQVAERKALQKALNADLARPARPEAPSNKTNAQKEAMNPPAATMDNTVKTPDMEKSNHTGEEKPDTQSVEGYKMEEMKSQDTQTTVSSSGVQWFAAVFILVMMALFAWGISRGKRG
ncbi:cobaltochelatase subunit CobN [Desulfocicer niacini]